MVEAVRVHDESEEVAMEDFDSSDSSMEGMIHGIVGQETIFNNPFILTDEIR